MNRKTNASEITCKRLEIAWVTESLKQHRLGMALKSVFAFAVISCLLTVKPDLGTAARHDISFCQQEKALSLKFAVILLRNVSGLFTYT